MSYTNLIYHIVFSTKERRETFAAERIARICKYAAGIIRNHEGVSYIRNQESHHRKMSFQDELIQLLDRHGVEYDPKYIR